MLRILSLLISAFLLVSVSKAVDINLNDNWRLSNVERNIEIENISIPSGVYSDLENAKLTESVLFSYNDVNLRWIGLDNHWVYTLTFDITKETLNHSFVILTFDGIDTISEVALNDKILGQTSNMFIRYSYDVKEILKVGSNNLSLSFTSAVSYAAQINNTMEYNIPPECPPPVVHGECHMNLLRKMQASFGWDWGLAAPSMGIWKDVNIEVYDTIIIRDITHSLSEVEEGWFLDVNVYVETGKQKSEIDGVLAFEIEEVEDSVRLEKVHVTTDEFGEGLVNFNMTIDMSKVKLWWPNGAGSQKLYRLRVRWEDDKVNEVVNYKDRKFYEASKTIKIGFRQIELVQERMSNGLSFYFKVNGEPIFMKGSNWIPSHILPEKSYEKEKIDELLRAARDANMNMVRVWGGGVYESDYFYSLADEYGILIWQDMMFACAMYPVDEDFLHSVNLETKQQTRRIQHHPSIALYATNNENEAALRQDWFGTNSRFVEFANNYNTLYKNITEEINKIDLNREVLMSSPSNGKYKNDQIYGISSDPQNPHFGDIHYYIYDQNTWKPEHFHQPRFASEYGFQSFPSGWHEIMNETDDLTELIDHRQHHPMRSKPIKFLILENLDLKTSYKNLEWADRIYLSQLSQAMAMKTETEIYRSGRAGFMNTMGALYWQLNDVWVAPSWSSIEHNGNYKIVHHWIEKIFAPLSIVTLLNLINEAEVYVINDDIHSETDELTLKMEIREWNKFTPVNTLQIEKQSFHANSAVLIGKYNMSKIEIQPKDYFCQFLLVNENNEIIAKNYIFPQYFKGIQLNDNPNIRIKIQKKKCEKNQEKLFLELKLDSPAYFIHIALNHPEITKYRLSKNGFIQLDPIQTIQISYRNSDCAHNITNDDFIVKSLNQFLK